MTTEATLLEERLYDYFIQTGSLSLPGIGTFRLQRISAQTDIASSKLLPPSYTVLYNRREDAPKRNLFDYLARRNGGDDLKAVRSVNQMSYTMRTRLLHGEPVELSGIGTILPDSGNGFRFEPIRIQYDFNQDVTFTRIIRAEATHPVLVGEEWVDSEKLEERLQDSQEVVASSRHIRRAVWIVLAIALSLILIRGLTGGFSSLLSRYAPFSPAEPPASHSLIK